MKNIKNTIEDTAQRVRNIENILMGGLPPTDPDSPSPNGGGGYGLQQLNEKIDELADRVTEGLRSTIRQQEIEQLKKDFDDLKRIIARLFSEKSTDQRASAYGQASVAQEQENIGYLEE